ncbi:uncharacterized protein [Diadema setosum]|uniref:uncharacterized protein n=1 Tax=Diadema setosum TaxID=31175 RepID=UPI003B3B5AD0
MLSKGLDSMRAVLGTVLDYATLSLTDILLTAHDVQSFMLAIFVLGLLSFTLCYLICGLLHNREKILYTDHGGLSVSRKSGGHSTRKEAHWTWRSFLFDHFRQKHRHGCVSPVTHSGKRSKQWIANRSRQQHAPSNLQFDNHRSGSRNIIISCREIPRSQASLSCVNCGLLPAKRKCSYQQCGACCRANKSSICSAHGTGDAAALVMVETACEEKPLEIDLSYMNLRSCPQHIGYLGRQLTVLNLSNNRLISLPEEIGLLGGLEQLFLQYNCLEELPKCIGNFSCLQELDCKNNHLQELPSTLGCLGQLTVLNVTNNRLRELTPSIGQLAHLEELCAHSNLLTTLPDELCNLVNLTMLYVGENPLHRLPLAFGRLVRLTELDLSSCELELLPPSLSRCTSLHKVWLSNNRLTSLPTQIGRLHLLKELHVRNNPLTYFPASLSYLQLYTFSVSQEKLLSEWDEPVRLQMTVQPKTSVPPLLELAARCVVGCNVCWKEGDLPTKLSEMLESVRWCSCCEGPFFNYFSSELVYANIGIFHRVPLYQQICSPFYNVRCQPVTLSNHQGWLQ